MFFFWCGDERKAMRDGEVHVGSLAAFLAVVQLRSFAILCCAVGAWYVPTCR